MAIKEQLWLAQIKDCEVMLKPKAFSKLFLYSICIFLTHSLVKSFSKWAFFSFLRILTCKEQQLTEKKTFKVCFFVWIQNLANLIETLTNTFAIASPRALDKIQRWSSRRQGEGRGVEKVPSSTPSLASWGVNRVSVDTHGNCCFKGIFAMRGQLLERSQELGNFPN